MVVKMVFCCLHAYILQPRGSQNFTPCAPLSIFCFNLSPPPPRKRTHKILYMEHK
jgi:hypothetical protein